MKERIFNIPDIVLFMTVAECFLLALFQTVLPSRNKSASILLSSFLLSVATSAICVLLLWNPEMHTVPFFDQTLLPYFLATSLLLKGITLYLYVRAITQQAFALDTQKWVHLVPIAICVLWLLLLHINSQSLLSFREPYNSRFNNFVINCLWIFLKVVPVAYALAALYKVRLYLRQLENQYSYFSTTEPGWLTILTLGFLFSWSVTLAVHFIGEFSSPTISDAFGIADNFIGFILINALFMYSVVYAHKLLATKPEPVKEKTEEKITDSAIEKVQLGMEVEKLYLKHNLNIEEFSKRINLPVKDVSAVINKHYGTNFFEFMNKYRIEEAKRLLLDESCAEMTVLDILLQAGFNSKSAFHRFFNRLVGVSPTEFRKQAQPQKAA